MTSENDTPYGDQRLRSILASGNMLGVALLRSREPLQHQLEKEGDWDLAVADPGAFGRDLLENFGRPDLRISRQYVEQWFYEWNQVDLLPVFEWNGLSYLDTDRFWKGVQKGDDGIPRPRLAHDALIAWMTGVLGGKSFKDRYSPMITSALTEDGVEFRECLREAFGKGWAEILEDWMKAGDPGKAAQHADGLRRALFAKQMRNSPGKCLAGQGTHWWTEFRHHLKPPYPWVAILGPDGSGKSSVIEGVQEKLKARRIGIKMIHWSPRILRKGQEAPGGVVPDPHSSPPRGLLMSTLKLGLITAEWVFGSSWYVRHPRAKSKLLVSDRYYNDLLVDPKRYRFGAPLSWARAVFGLFAEA